MCVCARATEMNEALQKMAAERRLAAALSIYATRQRPIDDTTDCCAVVTPALLELARELRRLAKSAHRPKPLDLAWLLDLKEQHEQQQMAAAVAASEAAPTTINTEEAAADKAAARIAAILKDGA